VTSGEGKCFRKLAPDLTETWVWNTTITDWPTIIVDGADLNNMRDEELIKVRQSTLHNVDFVNNGITYNCILYGRAIIHNVSGFSDGYTLDFILYALNYDVTNAESDKHAFAYALEDNYSPKGWQGTEFKTVTYPTIPKDTDFIAFRKTNATKTATSVAMLSENVEADTPAISSLMSLLIAK
jgi:hypothetical protein